MLIAVGNYSRHIVPRAMDRKNENETVETFKSMIRDNGDIMPKEITTDLGTEWSLITEEIESRGGQHRKQVHTPSTRFL